MKKIIRFICVSIFLFFAWSAFLYKKMGNKKYKLCGKTIIIANHYSTFDPFFIYLLYHKKKIHFVTIIETKKKLHTRFITWLFNCVYIDYSSVNLKFIKDSIKILNNDGILCIFPEGVINTRKYGFFDFYKSYIYLAKKTNSNILPLFVYPTLDFLKKSFIYIGELIPIEKINSFPTDEEANMYCQSQIMDYSDSVFSEVEKRKKYK